MRNLGGAIGIALVDTVIYGRAPMLDEANVRRLQGGDVDTAMLVKPMIDHLALVQAINEAWMPLAVLTVAAMLLAPFAPTRHEGPG